MVILSYISIYILGYYVNCIFKGDCNKKKFENIVEGIINLNKIYDLFL